MIHTFTNLQNRIKCVLIFSGILFSFSSAYAQTYVPAPYYTGFESGSLGTEWTATSSQPGTNIEVILSGSLTWSAQTALAFAGNYFLGMDYGTGGTYNLNQADLHLDLAGQSNLRLSFQWAEWNDESEAQDGIYISDDGGATYTKVLDLLGASQADLVYLHFDMSLDSINTVHGLTFSNQYIVRFQQYDNYYFAGGNDGFLFDEVDIYNVCNTSSSITTSACSSYTAPDGSVYNSTGVYQAIIPNTSGCDSVITINLTINNNASSISEVVCNSYTAPDGATYNTSGIYQAVLTNVAGCDSTITIDLTVNNATSSSINEVACEVYTAPDGNAYTSSGTYEAIIFNTNGCDSVITINLTINQATSSVINETGTFDYTVPSGDETYTVSGTYTDTIPNAAGCDSIITINLTLTGDVSIGENQNMQLVGYPNPVVDVFYVDGLEKIDGLIGVYVINVQGQLVSTFDNNDAIFNVAHLTPGMYYLVLNYDNGVVRLPFVKE